MISEKKMQNIFKNFSKRLGKTSFLSQTSLTKVIEKKMKKIPKRECTLHQIILISLCNNILS